MQQDKKTQVLLVKNKEKIVFACESEETARFQIQKRISAYRIACYEVGVDVTEVSLVIISQGVIKDECEVTRATL